MMNCECLIHRYHVAHLCVCGEIVSHSQADMDYHKFHGGLIGFDPDLFRHQPNTTPKEIFDHLRDEGDLDTLEYHVIKDLAKAVESSF